MSDAISETPTLHAGMVVADRYELRHLLGEGGMGVVWQARHLSLHVDVALKFLQVERAKREQSLARFEREAMLIARIRSPHVVQLLDYGMFNDSPYLAMELLKGRSLRERLQEEGLLSLQTTVKIVVEACEALSRAHRAQVVHRDIKPANIMLCDDDEGGFVTKLLDFGVAKPTIRGVDDHHTTTGALIGTPSYMSPEQALCLPDIDSRSDLFSLAIVAWRCLTGFLPHEYRNKGQTMGLGQLLVTLATCPPEVPSTVVPTIPRSIDRWFEKALSLQQTDRFPNAKAMADALLQAVREADNLASGEILTTSSTRSQHLFERPSAIEEQEGKVSPDAADSPSLDSRELSQPSPLHDEAQSPTSSAMQTLDYSAADWRSCVRDSPSDACRVSPEQPREDLGLPSSLSAPSVPAHVTRHDTGKSLLVSAGLMGAFAVVVAFMGSAKRLNAPGPGPATPVLSSLMEASLSVCKPPSAASSATSAATAPMATPLAIPTGSAEPRRPLPRAPDTRPATKEGRSLPTDAGGPEPPVSTAAASSANRPPSLLDDRL